jgi:hypothetical protein
MILSFTLIFAALAILLLLLYLEGGHNSTVNRMEDLAGRTRPVDLDAFRNLVDLGEEDFLRAHLRPRQFRVVQRERMRAALEYVQNAAHNAAFLQRIGEAATRSPDTRIAQAGKQLIDSALRLRAYALLSGAKLYLRMVFPQARLSYGRLADRYENLSALAGQLTRMQQSAPSARLSALL